MTVGREVSDLLMMCGYEDQTIADLNLKLKESQVANPARTSGADGKREDLQSIRRVKSHKGANSEQQRPKLNPVEVPHLLLLSVRSPLVLYANSHRFMEDVDGSLVHVQI